MCSTSRGEDTQVTRFICWLLVDGCTISHTKSALPTEQGDSEPTTYSIAIGFVCMSAGILALLTSLRIWSSGNCERVVWLGTIFAAWIGVQFVWERLDVVWWFLLLVLWAAKELRLPHTDTTTTLTISYESSCDCDKSKPEHILIINAMQWISCLRCYIRDASATQSSTFISFANAPRSPRGCFCYDSAAAVHICRRCLPQSSRGPELLPNDENLPSEY